MTVAYLIGLALEGLLVGALARLALPGKDPLSLLQTMALGLFGTFVAGVIFVLLDAPGPAPFFAGFFFAVLVMYVIRRRRGGGLTSPSAADPRKPGPYER